jgi:hypothetical protein
MKKIFRFVGLGGLLTAIFAVGAVASFGQDACADVDGQNALYQNEILPNYPSKDPAVLQKAIDAGKQFLEKYGACESTKQITDWLKPKVPVWEDRVKTIKTGQVKDKLYSRFNDSYKASNWDDVYASGKEILAGEPDKLDVILVLGSIGFDQAAKKNNKYNDDTLTYAKMALQKMASGATSEKFGLFKEYTYNTKENAIGWMNLVVGYIDYYGKDDKKGALPFIYQAALHGPETTINPLVYETIGKYFLGETIRLRDEIKAMIADQKDTDAEDVKAKKEADIKAKIALLNGNAERAIDGYARAYKVAKTDAATKAYRDGLYSKIKDLYTVRFQKDTGVDDFVASTTQKPLVDPTSPVKPIEDVEVKADTTTKTTTSATPTPTPTPATKPATAKPGQTSGVTKAATAKENAAKVSTETAATTKTNAVTKTPVAKKKGNR